MKKYIWVDGFKGNEVNGRVNQDITVKQSDCQWILNREVAMEYICIYAYYVAID